MESTPEGRVRVTERALCSNPSAHIAGYRALACPRSDVLGRLPGPRVRNVMGRSCSTEGADHSHRGGPPGRPIGRQIRRAGGTSLASSRRRYRSQPERVNANTSLLGAGLVAEGLLIEAELGPDLSELVGVVLCSGVDLADFDIASVPLRVEPALVDLVGDFSRR